jgi:hypothetical protein
MKVYNQAEVATAGICGTEKLFFTFLDVQMHT